MAKHDAFREKTLETVEYVQGHRSQITKYVLAAVAVLVVAGSIWAYMDSQHTVRVNVLNDALKNMDAQVVTDGNPPPFATRWFKSQDEKDKAVVKGFTELAEKYSGNDEGMIARYYLAVLAGDAGKAADAEKNYKMVVDNGSRDYASLAKLSLAQIYRSNGKLEDAKKLIQSLIDSPTTFVTKDQATIEMARLIAKTNPADARKLLEPLRTSVRTAISQSAIGLLGELSQQK